MSHHTLLLIATALAGGIGACIRFLVDRQVTLKDAKIPRQTIYPWGVTIVNLSGSFAIGLIAGLVPAGHPAAVVLGVGLLGGYTTFSTASYDSVRLFRAKRHTLALANTFLQFGGAVLAAFLGFICVASLRVL